MNQAEKAARSLIETIKAKKVALPDEMKPKQSAEVVQLKIKFSNDAPPAPNDLLRSAFFPAIQSKDRQFINDTLIASIGGVEISLKGEQLNQDDLDVFMAAQIQAQQQPKTLRFEITERGFLRMAGRKSGQTNEKALWSSLLRLKAAAFVINNKGKKVALSLIDEVYKDENTKRYVVQLNPRLNALLNSGSTFLALETRRQLVGKPLAQWLQAFYATHEKPYSYSVEKLRELSGSKTNKLFHFRATLRRALDDLKATNEIRDWNIDEKDNLCISKAKKIARQKALF